jgi:molecular chaperone HtpG
MKEGMVEDFANKDTLLGLLRFASTDSNEESQTVSLSDYVARMKDGQETIYYITAETHRAALGSPHLEMFTKKGLEVLLLSDPVDEWLVNSLPDFDGKKLQSVSKGDLDLSEDELQQQEEQKESMSSITDKLAEALADSVKEVRLTSRLTESPACLVADENDPGANLERIMKAMGQDAPSSKPILEINPEHPLIKGLKADDESLADWAQVLFDQAALSEGAQLKDPADYVKRINRLLLAS